MNTYGDDELVMARARESFAEVAADVVELRARRLCREAGPHAGTVPCPAHVVEARRQLAGGER